VKLPGLGDLRRLKQTAGSRLRAALVPELRELPGLVTVLSATREDLARLGQSLADARETLHQDLSDAEGKIQHLEDLHYELDRRVERIEERESDRADDLDSRVTSLEELREGLLDLLRD